MADDEAANGGEDKEESADAGEGGGKKKLIIIAVLAILLIGGGGAGAMFFLSGGSEPGDSPASEGEEISHSEGDGEKKESSESKGDGEKEDTPTAEGADAAQKTETAEGEAKDSTGIEFGDTFAMKTFNLNLGNALENRFVRMEITLEYTGGDKQKKEIEKRLPQLRDAIISVVSRKTREFLLSPDGKDTLRKEVLIRINRYMNQKIESVYITDILIE